MSTTSCRAVYMERGSFSFLHLHGGVFQHARSSLWAMPTSLPTGDTCSHDATLPIPNSARSRGIPHAGRALFVRHSCHEVPADDVTRGPACAVSRAGRHAPNVPETRSARSARSANRTRGMQHVMPRTRAHVGTRVFQIHLTLAAILTVHATVFFETRDVPAPESLHEYARARATQ